MRAHGRSVGPPAAAPPPSHDGQNLRACGWTVGTDRRSGGKGSRSTRYSSRLGRLTQTAPIPLRSSPPSPAAKDPNRTNRILEQQQPQRPRRKRKKRKLEDEAAADVTAAAAAPSAYTIISAGADDDNEEDDGSAGPEICCRHSHATLAREVCTQVDVLLSCLSCHRADRAADKRATHVLAELAKNEKVVNVIVEGGAVPAFVRHLEELAAVAAAQVWGGSVINLGTKKAQR